MDSQACRAAFHGVPKSWTWLGDWTELNWATKLNWSDSIQPIFCICIYIIFIIIVALADEVKVLKFNNIWVKE